MDPKTDETTQLSLRDRFWKSWFPPVAAVAAFGALVSAALRVRPTPQPGAQTVPPPGSPRPAGQAGRAEAPPRMFDRHYSRSAAIAGATSSHPFRHSLAGLAIGAGDRTYALGDDEVRVFDPAGSFVHSWKVPQQAGCVAVGADEVVYVGAANRVEIFDPSGRRTGGFAAGEPKEPAQITAIRVYAGEILVADANARIIRRYDSSGRQLGVIGAESKTGSFMLPNKSLDIAVDAKGVVIATDTGRHQVTSWAINGSPLGKFGKFGMRDPEDFVGCCNPVNLALTPDGKVVTAEKSVARVKVYEPGGRLLAVIGPENFDPACIHIYVAVDSKGRILAGDPVRREILVFTMTAGAGAREPAGGPVEPEPGEMRPL